MGEHPFGEARAEELARVRDELGLSDVRNARRAAACALALRLWRARIELLHDRFTEAEMAWMNLEATADALEVLPDSDPFTVPLPWAAYAEVLCHSSRLVLPGRAAREALGDHWPAFTSAVRADAARFAESESGAWVVFSAHVAHGWWGMPSWAARVDAFMAAAGVKAAGDAGLPVPEFERRLRADPRSLGLERWAALLDAGL